jgi:hypothetical protein
VERARHYLTAADSIAVREFKLEKANCYVDYLLFVDANAVMRLAGIAGELGQPACDLVPSG